MEMINKYFETYGAAEVDGAVENRTNEILAGIPKNPEKELLKTLFSLIDLTTLNTDDNAAKAQKFCTNVNSFADTFKEMSNVAAICVYPALVKEIKEHLAVKNVQIAAVGAGFPSSQTFLAVKLAECKLLVEKGADEVDIVISVGRFLAGEYDRVFDEIHLIKQTIGDAHLKVILETGLLKTSENIRLASLIAMEAGADFIKTSTGKLSPAATPEAVYVMLNAIKDYHSKTGRKIGIKPAGGIASVNDALTYHALVKEILGDEWISQSLFRLGASRLANNLLSAIEGQEISHF